MRVWKKELFNRVPCLRVRFPFRPSPFVFSAAAIPERSAKNFGRSVRSFFSTSSPPRSREHYIARSLEEAKLLPQSPSCRERHAASKAVGAPVRNKVPARKNDPLSGNSLRMTLSKGTSISSYFWDRRIIVETLARNYNCGLIRVSFTNPRGALGRRD